MIYISYDSTMTHGENFEIIDTVNGLFETGESLQDCYYYITTDSNFCDIQILKTEKTKITYGISSSQYTTILLASYKELPSEEQLIIDISKSYPELLL